MGLSTFDTFKHANRPENAVEVSGERLAELQAVLLMMLRDIDAVCQKSGAVYTLGGGSCLGSVRHRGFIPWDDDLDINMSRADFRRFRAALLNQFPEKYRVQVPGETPGYDLAFPRVRLQGTTVRTRDDVESDECGAYVDIFYVDNAPSGALPRLCHCFGSMAIGLVYSCRRFASRSEQYLTLASGNKSAVKVFKKKIALGRLFSFRTAEGWTAAWDRWNGRCTDSRSRYVCIPVGRKHYAGEIYERSAYYPASEGEFEGMEVPLPGDVKSYLTALYGPNYMNLPPEEDRETHVVYEFDLSEYAGIGNGGKGKTNV